MLGHETCENIHAAVNFVSWFDIFQISESEIYFQILKLNINYSN